MRNALLVLAVAFAGAAQAETAAKAVREFPLKSAEEITFIEKNANPAIELMQDSSYTGNILRSSAKNKGLGILSVFQFQKESKLTPSRCEELVGFMVGTLNKSTRKLEKLEISTHEGKSYCLARIINKDPKLAVKERLVVVRGMPTGLYGFVAKLTAGGGDELTELKEFVLGLK